MKCIYENKGVRLYYELPDDYAEVVKHCRILGIQPEHWQDCSKLLSAKVLAVLSGIDITTIPHDGGWGH